MTRSGLRVGRWEIPDVELIETFDTSGGPGGQHANRNKTAVNLRFDISESSSLPEAIATKLTDRLGKSVIEVNAADSRSQWRNRAIARQRLAALLSDALHDPAPRKPTRPTRASKNRRIESKRRRSETKKNRKPPEAW